MHKILYFTVVVRFIMPIFLMLITSLSCSKYPISGTVDMHGSNRKSVLYLIDPVYFSSLLSSYEGTVIDSAKVDKDGKFNFNKMPDCKDKKLFLLAMQNNTTPYPNKLEHERPENENYLPFIYQSGKSVIIKSIAKNLLIKADIDGNIQENKDIITLIQTRKVLLDKVLKKQDNTDESSLLDYEKSVYQFQRALTASLTNSTNIFDQALMLRWISPVRDYERVPEIVKTTCEKLRISNPNHPWTAQICNMTKSLPLTPGDVFPDFPMPMIAGDTLDLYSLLGQKLTLIDMWASWCAPCRHENKSTLVPLWEKFHDKGFQIVGYALDSSEKGWKNAIIKDGADRWMHSSHLKGDISPLFNKLKITTIPSNYLLDHQGKILAKNLHGEELKKWVVQYFIK